MRYPRQPVLPESAQTLDGTTVNVYYVTDPSQTATITLNYYFDDTYDASFDTTITPQVLSSVDVPDVVLLVVPTGYILSSTPTSPALPASAESLDGTTVNVYYVADPTQTATITLNYYFNGAQDASLDTTITPQILSSVTVADAALSTPPVGYMFDAIPTSPVLPASAQLLDGTTISVFYVTDLAQMATITLNYYFNGVHNASFDATITPQVLEQVTLSDVVLATTPAGYMLATPAMSPALPASALSLNNTTINIYYVSIGERITANNFRYPITSGTLTAADAIAFAGVVAYDANGVLIPASSLTVDAAQLAAINAAIAAGDLSGNPFPLTFYTPDGTAITIEVTLFGEVPPIEVPPIEVPPVSGQEPTKALLSKTGDGTDVNFILATTGTILGILLLALYKLRRARGSAE